MCSQTGFRSFLTKPIFSESNLNSDKHKFLRYLPIDGFSVASCIGPVNMTANCPLLVFRQSPIYVGQLELIATGNALSIDPDRIMLKKIVLFGNPIRVRKRLAVIKVRCKHVFCR
jgi:pre-rRNA-processing protein TSR1